MFNAASDSTFILFRVKNARGGRILGVCVSIPPGLVGPQGPPIFGHVRVGELDVHQRLFQGCGIGLGRPYIPPLHHGECGCAQPGDHGQGDQQRHDLLLEGGPETARCGSRTRMRRRRLAGGEARLGLFVKGRCRRPSAGHGRAACPWCLPPVGLVVLALSIADAEPRRDCGLALPARTATSILQPETALSDTVSGSTGGTGPPAPLRN